MSPKMIELALRKQRLQLKSAEQRGALVAVATRLGPALTIFDTVRDSLRWLRRHPEWVAGTVATLLVVRPVTLLRLARHGFFIWQIWRKVSAWRASAAGTTLAKLARLRNG